MTRGKLATVVLAIALSMAQSSRPRSASPADEVIAREKAAFDAWRRQDKAFYDDYWASDMTEFMPGSPRLTTKQEMMPGFAEMSRRWQLGPLKMIDPKVRFYGGVALLTYTEDVTGSYDGQPSHYSGKVTMVYVKQNGKWRGVHYHESKD